MSRIRQLCHPNVNSCISDPQQVTHQNVASYKSISDKLYDAGLNVELITEALDDSFYKFIKPV